MSQNATVDRPTSRGQFLATVGSNVQLCRDHYELVLSLPWFPPTAAGQFVQLACRDMSLEYVPDHEIDWADGQIPLFTGRELASPLALLRRPFSLAGRRDAGRGVQLLIIYRTVGVGTNWLSSLKPGDALHLIGPLGNCFQVPPDDGVAILVGGGVGIPPMLYLASMLAGRKAVAFCGATTRELLPLTITADAPASASPQPLYNIAEFARHGVPAVVTTDDGSWGYHGLVTTALELYLDRYFAPAAPAARSSLRIYTCGPEGMMKRVARIALDRQFECQVSVERAMACGMGTCQSCCIRVRKPDPAEPPLAGNEWAFRLACTDGPVFRAAELMW